MIRRFPSRRDLDGSHIEIEMTLPSGQLGVRLCGHRVLVRIDRSLVVTVHSPSSDRVLLAGAWNLCAVCWGELPEVEKDWELCRTAMEMIDARVEATIKLFARYYLSAAWLDVRARYEIGLGA